MSFPIAKKAAYEKFRNQASRFALVGVFVSKRGSDIRVAVTGAGSNGVFRVTSFEEALKKRFAPKSLEGLTIPATGMNADIHGSAEYRAHLVGVMARPRGRAGERGAGGPARAPSKPLPVAERAFALPISASCPGLSRASRAGRACPLCVRAGTGLAVTE